LLEEKLTHSVIGAFYEVYNTLGAGFLESIYCAAMDRELRARGHRTDREVLIEIAYKGETIGKQRLDMLVDGRLIVEIKSGYELHKSAARQLHNYLKASELEVGLLLHFGPQPHFFRLIFNRKRSTSPHAAVHPSHPCSRRPLGD
jgi:GxxExxY protein